MGAPILAVRPQQNTGHDGQRGRTHRCIVHPPGQMISGEIYVFASPFYDALLRSRQIGITINFIGPRRIMHSEG
jgi:hypothetical protein